MTAFSPFSNQGIAWLESCLGSKLTECQRLLGSTSSTLYRINGSFVLRVVDNPEWLAEEKDIPEHETAALREAALAGVLAPVPLAYGNESAGFGAPVVLMSYVQGEINLKPNDRARWLRALAKTLARIHTHPVAEFPWEYISWVNTDVLGVPAWTSKPALWEDAIALWKAPPPHAPLVFLHRDFHSCNVLWHNGEICGVVDWASACCGPAGVDVGHCCVDLALMKGGEVAQEFLRAYQEAQPGFIYEPYWDIDALLDMCLPAPHFYEPWEQFGLPRISQATLHQRLDDYLSLVLRGKP